MRGPYEPSRQTEDPRVLAGPIRVGEIFHGFCGGYFGRDSYGCRRVEAVGVDWIVCRIETGYDEGRLDFASGPDDILWLQKCHGRGQPSDCEHEYDEPKDTHEPGRSE
jgi:hypothetical protein